MPGSRQDLREHPRSVQVPQHRVSAELRARQELQKVRHLIAHTHEGLLILMTMKQRYMCNQALLSEICRSVRMPVLSCCLS